MSEPILIVGTRALAKAMGVGRQQIIDWLADDKCRFPATRAHKHAPWISTRQNLAAWSNARFTSKKCGRPARPGSADAEKRQSARRSANDSVDTKPKM